jgi:hypothetical protein
MEPGVAERVTTTLRLSSERPNECQRYFKVSLHTNNMKYPGKFNGKTFILINFGCRKTGA